jgi:hypothetical protein
VLIVCLIGGIYSILEGVRGGYPARYWRKFKQYIGRLFDNKLLAHTGGGGPVSGEKQVFVPYGVAIFIGGFFVAVSLINSGV